MMSLYKAYAPPVMPKQFPQYLAQSTGGIALLGGWVMLISVRYLLPGA